MAFQVSPGVDIQEIDATTVVPAVSTSIGGFAGAFNRGPVNEVTLVSSEKELASVFGRPDSVTAKYFLTAASFLKYGSALKVVRVVGAGATNATDDGAGLLIENADDLATGTGTVVWAARDTGEIANGLEVHWASGATGFDSWAYKGNVGGAPGTSAYATANGAATANDEIHVVVVDKLGLYTGNKGEVLEVFEFLSLASDAKSSDGSSIYYQEVINRTSKYIYSVNHASTLTNAGDSIVIDEQTSYGNEISSDTLTGGTADNANVGTSAITAGFDLFAEADIVDANLLFSYPDADGSKTIADKLIQICESRKDCMAFVSPPVDDTVGASTPADNVIEWANTLSSTSYAATDSGAVYVYDRYNDVYRWIGAAGFTAGLCAGTDNAADPWFSPAGLNRGQLLGVTKLAYNPTKAQRDELYKARVNPIVSFPGQGTVLFGDKTLLSRPSAFDRINVRRLFIALEKAIATASKFTLFELNDEFTRAQFRNLVEPFLRDVKGRRGVTDFLVVCDETNNTGQVIDSNQFVADIYIKPARSINFISLNFIATRTGVDFSEIAG